MPPRVLTNLMDDLSLVDRMVQVLTGELNRRAVDAPIGLRPGLAAGMLVAVVSDGASPNGLAGRAPSAVTASPPPWFSQKPQPSAGRPRPSSRHPTL